MGKKHHRSRKGGGFAGEKRDNKGGEERENGFRKHAQKKRGGDAPLIPASSMGRGDGPGLLDGPSAAREEPI